MNKCAIKDLVEFIKKLKKLKKIQIINYFPNHKLNNSMQ